MKLLLSLLILLIAGNVSAYCLNDTYYIDGYCCFDDNHNGKCDYYENTGCTKDCRLEDRSCCCKNKCFTLNIPPEHNSSLLDNGTNNYPLLRTDYVQDDYHKTTSADATPATTPITKYYDESYHPPWYNNLIYLIPVVIIIVIYLIYKLGSEDEHKTD